jgi:hypothetical protein
LLTSMWPVLARCVWITFVFKIAHHGSDFYKKLTIKRRKNEFRGG